MTAPALGPGSRWHAAVVELTVQAHAAKMRAAQRQEYRERQAEKWASQADTMRDLLDRLEDGHWQVPHFMRLLDIALARMEAWRALLEANPYDALLSSHEAARLVQKCERAKGRAV